VFWLRLEKDELGDLTPDYEVLLSRVQFDWRAVDELIFQLDEWLEHPKDELRLSLNETSPAAENGSRLSRA
jgi:hypothetical protein